MPLGKARTVEELTAAKEQSRAEYADLPDFSMFGGDNRATEKATMQAFDKLIAGADPQRLQDTLYDTADISSAMYDIVNDAIALCDWAMGWEDDQFEAKE